MKRTYLRIDGFMEPFTRKITIKVTTSQAELIRLTLKLLRMNGTEIPTTLTLRK